MLHKLFSPIVIGCALAICIAPVASAVRISDFFEIASFDLATIPIGQIDAIGSLDGRPVQTEGITVRPGLNSDGTFSVWFTGSADSGPDVKGFVFEARLDLATSQITLDRVFEHGFYDASQGGNTAEGIAYLPGRSGKEYLLVSKAPDSSVADSGVHVFDIAAAFTGTPTSTFLSSDPANHAEGLGLDLTASGDLPLWISDEADNRAREFTFDPGSPALSLAPGNPSFSTSAFGVELPEGIAVFGDNEFNPGGLGKDLLLVDDIDGRLVQVNSEGNVVDMLDTSTVTPGVIINPLLDVQGVDVIQEQYVFVVSDDDRRISVLALVPEPAAATIFGVQVLAASIALHRHRRRNTAQTGS